MDEFDDRSSFGVSLPGVSAGPGCDHNDQRPQPLAAAADDVFGDLIHEDDVAREALSDDVVDLAEVVAHQCFDGFEAHVEEGKRRTGEW